VFYDAFPDLRIEIRNVFASSPSPSGGGTDSSPSPSGGGQGGGYVTAEYDLLGTMRGEFLGHAPTGKAFRIKAMSIYEHNGTLFTRETVYYDSASLLVQIGLSPSDSYARQMWSSQFIIGWHFYSGYLEEGELGDTASAPHPDRLEIDEAFGFVFRSKGWFGKMLLLDLFALLSVVLVGAFFCYGYLIEISRAVRRGERELPPWDQLGKKFVDGFLLGI